MKIGYGDTRLWAKALSLHGILNPDNAIHFQNGEGCQRGKHEKKSHTSPARGTYPPSEEKRSKHQEKVINGTKQVHFSISLW